MVTHEYSAPGKIILVGEHAVVYGQPAIAIPLHHLRATARITQNLETGEGFRINAEDLAQVIRISGVSDNDPLAQAANILLNTLNASPPDVTITLRSSIPVASGLGSGAAIAAALGRALSAAVNKPLSNEALSDAVYEVEKIHHGTPSGIDNTVVVYEQPVYFVRGYSIESMTIGGAFNLLIADTGKPASTRVAVGDVRRLYEANQDQTQSLFDAIAHLVRQARIAIEVGDYAGLGRIMTENHKLLQQLTVSSIELDDLVQTACDVGALGAKLSGGGRGGNMIALVMPETISAVEQALRRRGAVKVFRTTLS